MNARPSVIVIAGGGHAQVVIEAILAAGDADVFGVVDGKRPELGAFKNAIPVLGDDTVLPELRKRASHFVVGLGGVGDNAPRRRLFELGVREGFEPLSVQHPAAFVAAGVAIGPGSFIAAGSVVGTGSELGSNVIVNTGGVVDHHCHLGDHVHVAPAACLGGGVVVEDLAHIGAGATVLQGRRIGAAAIVGAGATVISEVAAGLTVVGTPARPHARDARP